ncbi:rhomboid family intramembrane serine protease [Streptomyces sp. DSM 44917]|uniref:Rhomboid family intramembrane serine protease n=1 Tax=Streptomyces boetiae TaxID=3075541 RepID=A0ABU2L667_9ACTN|nr:rhomboid family intramembrane serine protease [Streptomyces sp. DSM 44917]MDT0307002.1 rhomboid family intramembrane serine protease [Streptomyces sp. DSM 44917]
MAQPHGQPPPQGLARCYRHPDRETGIRCTRCERPICPACMIAAPVGYQCPSCVAGGGPGGGPPARAARPRTLAGGVVAADPRMVTGILLGLNLAVFLAVLVVGDRLVTDLGMLGRSLDTRTYAIVGVAEGEWYRMLTSAFLHQQPWHLAFNMLGLWFLGPPLEAALGRVRFLALYLLSALAGSALSYVLAEPNVLSLGASGAIFGLFGATAVLMRRSRQDMRPILVLLAVNLVITFVWPDIAWQAHIGGLVAGGVIALAMVNAPRRGRVAVQAGTCAAVALAIVIACAVRTAELLG